MRVQDCHLGACGLEFYPVAQFVMDPAAQPLAELPKEGTGLAICCGGSIGIGHSLGPPPGLIVAFAEAGEGASGDDSFLFGGYSKQSIIDLEGVLEGYMIAHEVDQFECVLDVGAEEPFLGDGDC
jgi:hypothetical protein